MRIDEIKPYPGNPRNNEKAVPEVAKSIEAFGFKGAIVLRSREDPTIVNGHTRVAACKSLGWTEFPDEHIVYADDLTDEEVRALRLADNRTGEVATWNKALLKKEVRSLDKAKLDMGRYGFDFKSRSLPYGAERLKTDHAYNLHLVSAAHCGDGGMPAMEPVDHAPRRLTGFNYAKTSDDFDAGIHFFVDDYQFERVWNAPEKYLEVLGRFDCVLTPDFSLYMDMPLPMQQWNEYRRRALGNWWQRNGLTVIPTLSWSTPESYAFCFGGLKGGTVAVSTVGVKGDAGALKVWREGMKAAMSMVKPNRVLLYGGSVGFDFGKAEVVEYKANTAFGNRS